MADEMVPELRAAADRLMHTGGYLRHLANEMRANELERHCKATGLTVRQTVGHIVLWLELEARALGRYVAGEAMFDEPFDEEAINREFAEQSKEAPIAELLTRYRHAYDRTVETYGRVTAEMAAVPVGDTRLATLALQWTGHPERHALDFAEALPRLRFDPLLLDWALHAELRDPSELHRQLKLAEAARAYLKSREDTDDA